MNRRITAALQPTTFIKGVVHQTSHLPSGGVASIAPPAPQIGTPALAGTGPFAAFFALAVAATFPLDPVARDFDDERTRVIWGQDDEAFRTRTAWSRYNTCTERMKGQGSARQPDGFKALNSVITTTALN